MTTFSNNLIYLRHHRGLSQEALAEELRASRQSVGHWESGRQEPQLCYLVRLCEFFDVSIDEMVKKEMNKVVYVDYKPDKKRLKDAIDGKIPGPYLTVVDYENENI